jgi:SAM-dependent methyltransferase
MPRMPTFVERKLRRPNVDHALCLLLKRRRIRLPQVDPALVWPGFADAPATVRVLPRGDWSAPTTDIVVLMKMATVTQPRRIVELGSYRGYTAVGLLEHAHPDATLVAVDIDPEHGEAYRGTALEARIDRRVMAIDLDGFGAEERKSFDLVFVDADHRRDAVAHDTEVALELVTDGGCILWHDYNNWGWFTGDCGVPEVLNELAEELPVAHLLGSTIAIHRPEWRSDPGSLAEVVEATRAELRRGHWKSGTARRFGS